MFLVLLLFEATGRISLQPIMTSKWQLVVCQSDWGAHLNPDKGCRSPDMFALSIILHRDSSTRFFHFIFLYTSVGQHEVINIQFTPQLLCPWTRLRALFWQAEACSRFEWLSEVFCVCACGLFLQWHNYLMTLAGYISESTFYDK